MALKEYCTEYWLKELQESMDRCTGHRDLTEILLKTTLNIIQSIITHIFRFCMLKNHAVSSVFSTYLDKTNANFRNACWSSWSCPVTNRFNATKCDPLTPYHTILTFKNVEEGAFWKRGGGGGGKGETVFSHKVFYPISLSEILRKKSSTWILFCRLQMI